MGVSQQRKGRSGELELVEKLRLQGIPARPGNPVSYGQTPDITGVPGVHVEVKRVERLNIESAVDQAVRDAQRFQDGAPAVFHRKNRRGWLVTMRFEDWVRMYRHWMP